MADSTAPAEVQQVYGPDINGAHEDFGEKLLQAAQDGDAQELIRCLKAGADINALDESRCTVLHKAALYGRTELTRILLARNDLDVNAQDEDGETALYQATVRKEEAIIELLLKAGATITIETTTGDTALHQAASENYLQGVELLLGKGKTATIKTSKEETALLVNDINGRGDSVLHVAARHGSEDVVKLLLKCEVDTTALDKGQKTALYRAFESEEIYVVKLLPPQDDLLKSLDTNEMIQLAHATYSGHLSLVRELMSKVESKDMILLHWAAAGGQRKVAELLLEKGSRVSSLYQCGTPLHFAAIAGEEEVSRLLLDNGADVNANDQYGMTPLHWAAEGGSTEVVKLLLQGQRVAMIDSVSADGQTALHWATEMGKRRVVEHLLEEGADFEWRNEDGCTPLHLASVQGHAELIDILIEKGANSEAKQRNGGTPLHLAAYNNRTDAIRKLLDHKVVSNARDDDDWTVLHWAADKGSKDAMELLLLSLKKEITEMIAAENKDGNTALHHACAEGHFEVVKLLLDKMKNTITAQVDRNKYALAAAARSGAVDVVQLLVDWEANLISTGSGEERNMFSMTEEQAKSVGDILWMNGSHWERSPSSARCSLQWAARKGDQCLLESVLSIDPTLLRSGIPDDVTRATPLYWSAFGGQEKLAKLLAEKLMGNPRRKVLPEEDGLKALQIAVRKGYNTIAQDLLEKMSDEPGEETNRWTPLHWAVHWAVQTQEKSIVQDMLRSGAKPEERIENGMSALKLAEKLRAKVIQTLLENPLRFPRKPPPLKLPDSPGEGPTDVCNTFTANIVDFSLSEGTDTTLPIQKSVYDIIYGSGPEKIMEEIRRSWDIKQLEHQFRWIHLPANNWRWLKDLVQRISKDANKTAEEYARVENFISENRRDGEHLGDAHCRFMNTGVRVRYFTIPIASSLSKSLTMFQFHQIDFTSSKEASSISTDRRQQTASKTDAPIKRSELPTQEEPNKQKKSNLPGPEHQEKRPPKPSENKQGDLEGTATATEHVENVGSQMSRANAPPSNATEPRPRAGGTGNGVVPSASNGPGKGETNPEQKKPTMAAKAGQSVETTKKRDKDRVYDTRGMTGLKGSKMAIWVNRIQSNGQRHWRNAIRMVQQVQQGPDDFNVIKKDILGSSINEALAQVEKEKVSPGRVNFLLDSSCCRTLSAIEEVIKTIREKTDNDSRANLDDEPKTLERAIEQLRESTPSPSLSVFRCLEDLQEAVEIYSGKLETSKETQLLRYYLGLSPRDDVTTHHLHVSRTLDQYHYSSLPDTRRRDADQVVRRYQNAKCRGRRSDENQLDNQNEHNQNVNFFRRILDLLRLKSSASDGKNTGSDIAPPPPTGKPDMDSRDFRMCMVDQLWLWIIDDNRWDPNPEAGERAESATENGEDRLIHRISKHISEDIRPQTRTVYEMAALITSFCTDFVDQCKVKADGGTASSPSESFLHVFADSIGVVMDKEVQYFEDFRRSIAARHKNTQTNHDSHSPNLELRLEKEIALLEEIKDIRDELNILRSICTDQDVVLKTLSKLATRGKDSKAKGVVANDRILDYYRQRSNIDTRIARIKKMQQDVRTAYDAMNHLLDLKQKDANILEAAEARKQAEATTKQGRTIMVFTIVTIIFVRHLPGTRSPSTHPVGTTAALAVPLIIMAFKINEVLDFFEKRRRNEGGNNHNNHNKHNSKHSKGNNKGNSKENKQRVQVAEKQTNSHGRYNSRVDQFFRPKMVVPESDIEQGLANGGERVSTEGGKKSG
ncbi:hypothetical protein AYO20_10807 [Fonsecaea nubica]|uniref:Uncharacterized protein n=1 Tax=Fonsecaea nubica TaxID=856822 RepID=A0A178C2Z4_9EURO|nr:hypothetical protein AYO20_10807 [Fonsecaea nubica]OAL23957.1 hypothetical protein AYO20_10807 [Fonsecaea nubica]